MSYTALTNGQLATHTALNDIFTELDSGSRSVKQHGAVGDGVTDDTTAVNAAITAAMTAGIAVYFPEGTYLLSTWAELSTTAALYMYGNGATIDLNDTSVDVIRALHDVTLRNLKFTNCGTVVHNVNTDTSSITEIRVEGCTFDTVIAPIDVEEPFQTLRVVGCFFDSCMNTGIRVGRNVYAEQDNWKRIVIADNVFKDFTNSGAADVRGALVYGRNLTFSGNVIDTLTGVAGNETHGLFTKCRYASIVGNSVRGVNTGDTITGFSIKGSARDVVTSPQGFAALIVGNTIYCNGAGSGIRVLCDDSLVSDNIVDDPGVDGIAMEAGDFNRIAFRGNRVYGTGRASTVGIRQTLDGDSSDVSDNEVHDLATGIRVSASGAVTPKYATTNYNKITSCTTGVSYNAASVITNCQVIGNQIDGATNGIRFDGTAPDVVEILDNQITATTTPVGWGATSAPTNLQLRQQYRVQTTDDTTTSVFSQAIPDASAYMMETRVTAMESDGSNRNLYHKKALLYRNGGGATVQGAVADVITDIESAAGWTTDIAVGSNDVRARVLGAIGTTVNWVLLLELVSLT